MVGRDRYMRWLMQQVNSILLAGYTESTKTLLGEFGDITQFQKARRAKLLEEIETHLVSAYDSAHVFHRKEMRAYAGFESQVSVNEIKNLLQIGEVGNAGLSFSVLSPQKVKAITELPINGLTLGDWWEQAVNSVSVKAKQQIQVGLLQGEDARQIAKRIVPTPGPDAGPVLYKQGARSAEMLVRTTLTSVENQANIETMKDMGPDVTESYRFTATRDSRTSIICATNDGKVFKYSDPAKKVPPLHPNCRSTTIPIVNYKALGIPQSVIPKDSYKMSDFSSWLKKNPDAAGDVLGKSRAGLFLDGKVSLADLVSADNKVYTLAQLREFAK